MGKGYSFTCKKCGFKYCVYPGYGFMYPQEYKDRLNEIKSGVYGLARKEMCDHTPNVAINAARVIYICNNCHRWETGTDVTLYAPNTPGMIQINDMDDVFYADDQDLERNYHVVMRYYHSCDKCGKRMHKASMKELQNLSCPECGESNQTEGILMWD